MAKQLQDQLAEQLRDVHLPDAIHWWPLAPGWWLLLGASLLVCVVLYWLRHKSVGLKNQSSAVVTLARIELAKQFEYWQNHKDGQEYLRLANSAIKRYIHAVDAQNRALSTSGKAWISQLAKLSDHSLSTTTEKALAEGLYQLQPVAEVEQIHNDLMTWLDKTSIGKTTLEATHRKRVDHA